MLPALVGRDTEALDEKEMARAVVESRRRKPLRRRRGHRVVGDAVRGARARSVHRALNTLDAMVGHRTERYHAFGWASARLDDLLGWPAARLTAALVALARPAQARAVFSTVRSQAHRHPSPNAGVAEAAFAAALGLQLGGPNRYGGREEIRPLLGTGKPAEAQDVARAVALADDVVTLLMALGAASAVARLPAPPGLDPTGGAMTCSTPGAMAPRMPALSSAPGSARRGCPAGCGRVWARSRLGARPVGQYQPLCSGSPPRR